MSAWQNCRSWLSFSSPRWTGKSIIYQLWYEFRVRHRMSEVWRVFTINVQTVGREGKRPWWGRERGSWLRSIDLGRKREASQLWHLIDKIDCFYGEIIYSMGDVYWSSRDWKASVKFLKSLMLPNWEPDNWLSLQSCSKESEEMHFSQNGGHTNYSLDVFPNLSSGIF